MVGSGGMAMILWIGDKADAMSVAEEPSSAGMHVLIACGILLVITGTLSFAGAYRRNQTVVCAVHNSSKFKKKNDYSGHVTR